MKRNIYLPWKTANAAINCRMPPNIVEVVEEEQNSRLSASDQSKRVHCAYASECPTLPLSAAPTTVFYPTQRQSCIHHTASASLVSDVSRCKGDAGRRTGPLVRDHMGRTLHAAARSRGACSCSLCSHLRLLLMHLVFVWHLMI